MRQFYALPALIKVLRLNKNRESIKIVFWNLCNICLAPREHEGAERDTEGVGCDMS